MGKIKPKEVQWDSRAFQNFIDILNYIKKDSPANAVRVKNRILKSINSIHSNPEMFREDELKMDNNGTFSVFNKDSIRISYKIEPNAIVIARVRHSSQDPSFY